MKTILANFIQFVDISSESLGSLVQVSIIIVVVGVIVITTMIKVLEFLEDSGEKYLGIAKQKIIMAADAYFEEKIIKYNLNPEISIPDPCAPYLMEYCFSTILILKEENDLSSFFQRFLQPLFRRDSVVEIKRGDIKYTLYLFSKDGNFIVLKVVYRLTKEITIVQIARLEQKDYFYLICDKIEISLGP
jgi:hypothetical protein